MRLRPGYALATVMVFVTEVVIALFVHDRLIRPYIGDVLALILVYLAIRAATPWAVVPAVGCALAFAVGLELSQLFHLGERLGLAGTTFGVFVLGGAYDVKDLVCYGLGAGIVVVAETVRQQRIL